MSNLYYVEIKKYLIELIELNKHIPNYKLPSENYLAHKFNTSRLTVRSAMNQLVDKGLINRYQGRGTFINTRRLTNTPLKDFVTCIIVPNIASRFVQSIINGAIDTFNEINALCVIYQTHNSQSIEERILENLTRYHISGVLIYPASGSIYNKGLLQLALKNYPTVSIDRNLHDLNLDCVLTDHYQMLYDCTTSLIHQGFRHIALIHPEPQAQSTQLRLSGYINAQINLKITPSNENVLMLPYNYFAKFTQENSNQLVNLFIEFWKQHSEIDAVISLSSFVAMPLLQSINAAGKKIDITFIDDEYTELKKILPIKYNSLIQDGYTIGKTAAQLLIEKSNNPQQTTKILHIPTLKQKK